MIPKIGRVLGPYRNGERWRLVVFDGGQRKALLADSQPEAEKIKQGLLRMFGDRSGQTIGAALDEYFAEKRRAGLKEDSMRHIEGKLRPFLPPAASLGEITPQRAAKMYLDETERVGRFGPLRAATHQKLLRLTKAFFGWAVERDYIQANPFARVKSLGKANAGKVQLRQDEARKLNDLAIARAVDGDEGALAVLVQLVMGLRSGEVLNLKVRDLDADGTALVIDGSKTKNARRTLEIQSEPLRELLVRHCATRDSEDLIFGSQRGKAYHSNHLFKTLRRLCRDAGIPKVCPHSLRGLHSSLAVARGASSRFVAEALGHGSDTITKRHYIAPDALKSATTRRVADALSKPAPESLGLDTLAAALRNLQPAQLESLLAAVGVRR